jgi:protein-S-isoprenylcysteine O-methyltransferase Ste14
MLCFGIGFAFENWLSLIALVNPVVGAIVHRVQIEATALKEHFGHDYAEYARPTKRFLPLVP